MLWVQVLIPAPFPFRFNHRLPTSPRCRAGLVEVWLLCSVLGSQHALTELCPCTQLSKERATMGRVYKSGRKK